MISTLNKLTFLKIKSLKIQQYQYKKEISTFSTPPITKTTTNKYN